MAKGNKSTRTRNYATMVYPESAPENWAEILEGQNIPALVSPLHDKDINVDGEPKKAHFHVMIMFDSVKTPDQAREVFEKIGGVGCEIVQSIRGYARYLCHMDNPDKFQYDVEDVWALCGVDYESIIGLASDKYKAIKEMIVFCDTQCIKSYHVLLLYAQEERYDWFRVLCDSGTYVMKEYLKSKTWQEKQYKENEVE